MLLRSISHTPYSLFGDLPGYWAGGIGTISTLSETAREMLWPVLAAIPFIPHSSDHGTIMVEQQRDRPMPGDTIAIAADHAGAMLKAKLVEDIARRGYKALDLGTNGPESVDYPDYAKAVCNAIAEGRAQWGVLVCGSGIGMSIAANRNVNIRAALCHDALSARLSRQHNNANVLTMGARLIGEDVAQDCLQIFLATAFEGGRHERRVAKL